MSLFKRYVILIFVLTIQATGIVFVVNSSLGTPPISSLPYVFSLVFGRTFGQTTFVWNVVLVLIQIALLRKDFQKVQYLQIPMTFLFAAWLDIFMKLFANVIPEMYAMKIAFVVIGAALIAFSVAVQGIIKVLMMPGEGVVFAISQRFRVEIGRAKMFFDCASVFCSIVLSLAVFHKIAGFREGTIISALITGPMVRFFLKTVLKPFKEKAERAWLAPGNK